MIKESSLQNEYWYNFDKPFSVTIGQKQLNQAQRGFVERQFNINDIKISLINGKSLEPLFADWLDLALAIYISDRLSPRKSSKNKDCKPQWSRVINLRLPVRKLEVWLQTKVYRTLQVLLCFLTEDHWNIEFIPYVGAKRLSETQEIMFSESMSRPVRVALFSGGLDSFVGAIQQITEFSNSEFLFVSGSTNCRQRAGQREQFNMLARHTAVKMAHIPVSYNLIHNTSDLLEETSQRSRGFLFLTLGAIVAIKAGSNEFYLYENGIGAINLPYDGTQVGTLNSRAVNPITLSKMTDFISSILQEKFEIHNPFWLNTKSEMCAYPEVQRLAQYITHTFSCDSFPIRQKDKSQCGSCTSCLLRRLSLETSKLGCFDKSKIYLRDLLSTDFQVTEKHLLGLRAMEWQYHQIKSCLENTKAWQSISHQFPELNNIVTILTLRTDADASFLQQSIIKLYNKYILEWENFSARRLLISKAYVA